MILNFVEMVYDVQFCTYVDSMSLRYVLDGFHYFFNCEVTMFLLTFRQIQLQKEASNDFGFFLVFM